MLGLIVLTIQLPTQMTVSMSGGIWPGDPSSFLLPAFSGFFAVPALLFSSGNKTESRCLFSSGERMRTPLGKPLLRSLFPSLLVGWIPGITNAYATSLVTIKRRAECRSIESSFQYLVTYSATNVGGSLQSIVAMATIFRARNGTLEAINDHFSNSVIGWFEGFEPPMAIISFIWAACIAAVVGAWSCMFLGRRVLGGSSGKSFKIVRISMMVFILILVLWSSGPVGLLVLFTCFILGAWSLFNSAPRVHLMGFLLVPVIIYFLSN